MHYTDPTGYYAEVPSLHKNELEDYESSFSSALERKGLPLDKEKNQLGIRSIKQAEKALRLLEKDLTERIPKVHEHWIAPLYNSKDLKAAIEFLESFVLYEQLKTHFLAATERILPNVEAPSTEEVTKVQNLRDAKVVNQEKKFFKAIKELENLYEIASLPKGQREAAYGSQGKEAIKKVAKIFNDTSRLDRIALKTTFHNAEKTLQVFHNRWK